MTVLIRQALEDLKLQDELTDSEVINDAVAYFNRQEDHLQVRAALKKRYDVGVKSVQNPGEGTGVTETYVKGHLSTKIDEGQVENFSIGFASKVVNALATLFTEKGQKFSLVHETAEDIKAAEKLLFEENRNESTFDSTIVDVDKLSVQVGSAALFIEFNRGRLNYKKISPADLKFYYRDYIDEEGKKRTTDRTDIEDATAVVINLGTNDNQTWNYLAIWGRSDVYPNGRYAQFQDSQIITRLPNPYNGTIEFEIEGEIANPLTYWGNQPENSDKDIPEYPIIIFKGGTTESTDTMPVYTSLYEAAIEFDISASHTEGRAQKNVSGTKALTRTHEAKALPIPPSLDGDISLMQGQDIKIIPSDASSIQTGRETTEQHMIHTASGYGVPDYMVISKDHTLEASSGVALAVKTAPLIKQRDYRIKINRPAVKKMFNVEIALIGMFAPSESDAKDADIKLLLECSQTWDAGEVTLPENQNELTTRLVTAKEKGIIDEVEAIRIFHQLSSDEEAMALYNKMKERAGEYPPLVREEPKKPQLGLRNRQPPPASL